MWDCSFTSNPSFSPCAYTCIGKSGIKTTLRVSKWIFLLCLIHVCTCLLDKIRAYSECPTQHKCHLVGSNIIINVLLPYFKAVIFSCEKKNNTRTIQCKEHYSVFFTHSSSKIVNSRTSRMIGKPLYTQNYAYSTAGCLRGSFREGLVLLCQGFLSLGQVF